MSPHFTNGAALAVVAAAPFQAHPGLRRAHARDISMFPLTHKEEAVSLSYVMKLLCGLQLAISVISLNG